MVDNSSAILMEILPRYFRPVLEFQAIMNADGHALDKLSATISQVWANNYIATCDESTLAFWENLLGLTDKFGDTLEYRRDRIMQKFNNIGPFSIGYLNDRLTELYGESGYTLAVDYVACTLTVEVTSSRYGAVDLLYGLLWDIVPAHMQIIANQEVINNIGGSRLYTRGFVTSTFVQTIGGNT